MFSKRAEKRIDGVVEFFERLEAELDRGVAECNDKRAVLFESVNALQSQAAALRVEATNAGEAIGRAVRLRHGLRALLHPDV